MANKIETSSKKHLTKDKFKPQHTHRVSKKKKLLALCYDVHVNG